MRPCPIVAETASVGEILHRMVSEQEPAFAVVSDDGRLSGIITEYDLVKLVYESGQYDAEVLVGQLPAYLGWSPEQLRALTAADIMTNDAEGVGPDMDLEELLQVTFRNHRKVVLVVEHGRLIGQIRRLDLVKKVLG